MINMPMKVAFPIGVLLISIVFRVYVYFIMNRESHLFSLFLNISLFLIGGAFILIFLYNKDIKDYLKNK
jgi:uncharacterized membrane protein